MSSFIPVVDVELLRSGDPDKVKKAAGELLQALMSIGFVFLKNHGIPRKQINEAFQWSHKFFDLLLSEKMKAPHPPEGWHHRGYSPPGLEKVTHEVFEAGALAEIRGKAADKKESFDLGRDGDARLTNVWPPEDVLPGFRAFFDGFYQTCFQLEDDVLRAVATCLGIDRDYLLQFHTGRENQLRLLRYPEVEAEKLQSGEVERIGAHTDYGTMTFLFQDDVGGLEVQDPVNRDIFRPVSCIPGTVVLNVGDLLQRWSNDILKSTMHRVGAPSEQAWSSSPMPSIVPSRYSMAYFVGTDSHVTVDCIPGCYGEGRPKKYKPVNAREYIDLRANAAYA